MKLENSMFMQLGCRLPKSNKMCCSSSCCVFTLAVEKEEHDRALWEWELQ